MMYIVPKFENIKSTVLETLNYVKNSGTSLVSYFMDNYFKISKDLFPQPPNHWNISYSVSMVLQKDPMAKSTPTSDGSL